MNLMATSDIHNKVVTLTLSEIVSIARLLNEVRELINRNGNVSRELKNACILKILEVKQILAEKAKEV